MAELRNLNLVIIFISGGLETFIPPVDVVKDPPDYEHANYDCGENGVQRHHSFVHGA